MFSDKGLKKPHLEITIPSPKLPLPASQPKYGFCHKFQYFWGYETHLFLLLKKQLYSDVPLEKKQTQMCRSLSFVRGYAKICDLGFARFVLSKTYTFLGTPDAWLVILQGDTLAAIGLPLVEFQKSPSSSGVIFCCW